LKNILIIHPGPFGKHSATLYFCKLLKHNFNVHYVGIDEGNGFLDENNINILHLKQIRNKFIRKFNYFILIYKKLKSTNYSFILINYFPFCSFLLFFNKNINVEVRSGYIFPSKSKRCLYNLFLRFEVKLFNNVITLSSGLKDNLKLPIRTSIIPLGGPKVKQVNLSFEKLNFLYVGTFRQRNIDFTIEAFRIFLNDIKNNDVQYHIVGFGSEEEIYKINLLISKYNLEKFVFFHGEVRYPELSNIFSNCNVGISYIPDTEYFRAQPSTKTFEYLLNGMPVIATNILEHKILINSNNGILVNEDPISFASGFTFIYNNRFNFNSFLIQNDSNIHSWEYIVDQIFVPYILNQINKYDL
jgi:hypothetical protein